MSPHVFFDRHFMMLDLLLQTDELSHRIHVWYIYIYIYANIWGILMVNVTTKNGIHTDPSWECSEASEVPLYLLGKHGENPDCDHPPQPTSVQFLIP